MFFLSLLLPILLPFFLCSLPTLHPPPFFQLSLIPPSSTSSLLIPFLLSPFPSFTHPPLSSFFHSFSSSLLPSYLSLQSSLFTLPALLPPSSFHFFPPASSLFPLPFLLAPLLSFPPPPSIFSSSSISPSFFFFSPPSIFFFLSFLFQFPSSLPPFSLLPQSLHSPPPPSPLSFCLSHSPPAALQSVFPQSELGAFMAMTKREKERHLQELTMIVTGIRLFNKDCGKGGEGIDDLPSFLNEGIPATTQNLDMEISQTLESINKYTALLERMHEPDCPPTGLSMQLLKESLINARQHEALMRIILADVVRSAEQVEGLMQQLASRMEQLQNTVQSKTAVPTAQVYPQFLNLSEIWSGFQDEMVLLSVLTNILNNLDAFTRNHRNLFTDDVMAPFLDNLKVLSDAERKEETDKSEHHVTPSDFRNVEWLFPETTKNFEKLPLQYRGFCGWSLVRYDRMLVRANPVIGVLLYKNCYYAFASKNGAYEFAKNPDAFIRAVADAARKSPELIQLLELHHQFSTISPYAQGREKDRMIEKPLIKAEIGTQTDTHLMESNIVKNYEWNEWELRRKAIKLANLRRKITHSMQTNLSNYRRDNVSQVYLPKQITTQTKRDNYSNVPKPSVFHAGLRGGGMDVPTVLTKVDLTIPVEQQLLGQVAKDPACGPP